MSRPRPPIPSFLRRLPQNQYRKHCPPRPLMPRRPLLSPRPGEARSGSRLGKKTQRKEQRAWSARRHAASARGPLIRRASSARRVVRRSKKPRLSARSDRNLSLLPALQPLPYPSPGSNLRLPSRWLNTLRQRRLTGGWTVSRLGRSLRMPAEPRSLRRQRAGLRVPLQLLRTKLRPTDGLLHHSFLQKFRWLSASSWSLRGWWELPGIFFDQTKQPAQFLPRSLLRRPQYPPRPRVQPKGLLSPSQATAALSGGWACLTS